MSGVASECELVPLVAAEAVALATCVATLPIEAAAVAAGSLY